MMKEKVLGDRQMKIYQISVRTLLGNTIESTTEARRTLRKIQNAACKTAVIPCFLLSVLRASVVKSCFLFLCILVRG